MNLFLYKGVTNMTKYNKIKQIITVFRNENNDARVDISIEDYINHNLHNLTFTVKCKFKCEIIEDIDYRMFITSSIRYPSIMHISVLDDMDYTLKDLRLNEFSQKACESLINGLLDALKYELDAKLNTEEIYRKNRQNRQMRIK